MLHVLDEKGHPFSGLNFLPCYIEHKAGRNVECPAASGDCKGHVGNVEFQCDLSPHTTASKTHSSTVSEALYCVSPSESSF